MPPKKKQNSKASRVADTAPSTLVNPSIPVSNFGTGAADAEAAFIGYGGFNWDSDVKRNPHAQHISEAFTWKTHNHRHPQKDGLDLLHKGISTDLDMNKGDIAMPVLAKREWFSPEVLAAIEANKTVTLNNTTVPSLPQVTFLWQKVSKGEIHPMGGSVSGT